MDERKYYVYGYIRLDTNTYFYIGKGKDNRYLRLDNRKQHFMNIYNKVECAVEILYDNLTEDEAFQLEVDTIYDLVFNEGYSIDIKGIRKNTNGCHLVNCTWGGEGTSGLSIKQSQETIDKRVAKNTGKKRTEEQKENLRNGSRKRLEKDPHTFDSFKYAMKGKKRTEEQKNQISEKQKGKKLSQNHKDKISKGLNNRSQEEKNKTNEQRSEKQGTAIYCIELDLKFTSVHKAEKYCHDVLGISFNHKTFKKYMSGDWKQNWYQEIEINGELVKLHWEYY